MALARRGGGLIASYGLRYGIVNSARLARRLNENELCLSLFCPPTEAFLSASKAELVLEQLWTRTGH